jgi:fatty acyl-CoA reductase
LFFKKVLNFNSDVIQLFDRVKKLHPDLKSKLVAVNGDLTEPSLGISQEDKETLAQKVHIVYHSAATVRFDEPMKVAVNMNIIGVQKVIELCKTIKNLQAFIHISTAYANCDYDHISEEIYNPPVKYEKLIEACEWIEDDCLDLITPKVIKQKPNTYTYTKQIAESVILQECKDMPVSIIRPSIIGATWREPFPGWVENFNGPTALFPACGKGVLSAMLGNHEAIADIIPVDVSVNLMIAVAWFTARKNNKKIVVFNNTSGQINKFTWGMFEKYGRATFAEFPFEKPFFIPDPKFTSNR